MKSKEIKDLRVKLGISQEAMGAIVGVSWRTIYRWEKGENPPSRLAVEKLTRMKKEMETK